LWLEEQTLSSELEASHEHDVLNKSLEIPKNIDKKHSLNYKLTNFSLGPGKADATVYY
jgi:hypothetical protein